MTDLKDSQLKTEVQKWLISIFQDPIVKILIKNSNLTKIQLETFLIDVLAEKISEKEIVYEQKAKLRLVGSGVSRGAFNRTASQARKNITRSIYTMILLGYLGIFDTPYLDPYIEIANKIRVYTEAYRESWKEKGISNEHLRVIKMLQEEIEKGLEELSRSKVRSHKM